MCVYMCLQIKIKVNMHCSGCYYKLRSCYINYHCSKFYEKEALLADPVDGHILASLLGECKTMSVNYVEVTGDPLKSVLLDLILFF